MPQNNGPYLGPTFVPVQTTLNSKYGPSGLFTPASFDAHTSDPTLAASLCNLANHSISKSTWSSYRTAANMLQSCCLETATVLTYPVGQNVILLFIGWLHKRNLSATTINSYLSGLRQLHLSLGLQIPVIRTDLVKQVLAGKKVSDEISPKLKSTRIPVTPTVLRILKLKLSLDYELSVIDMRLYWFLCTLAFHGSFRMGELLVKSPVTFDPRFSLMGSDLQSKETSIDGYPITFLEVTLRSSKTSPTSATVIDVFPTNTDICPIRAFKKWSAMSQTLTHLPVFRLQSGKLLTPSTFNKKLRVWLKDSLDFSKTTISGHSFRAGLVSVLGTLGFDDKDLKSVGRWSSRAFQIYTKLPRTKRLAMARAMGDLQI